MSERGDGGRTTTTQRRKSSSNTRGGGTRTGNMDNMLVTELTSQSPMGWLKAKAAYSAARDGRPCGVSGDLGARGWATTTTQRRNRSSNTREGGTRT